MSMLLFILFLHRIHSGKVHSARKIRVLINSEFWFSHIRLLRKSLYNEDMDDLDEDETVVLNEEDEKRFLKEEYVDGGSQTFLTAVQARKHLRELWLKEHTVLGYLFGSMREAQARGIENPTDLFFIEVLAISPPKFRPVSPKGPK